MAAWTSQPERWNTMSQREQRCLLAQSEAWTKNQSSCTVAELFSPPRFAAKAQEWGRPGLSYDIKKRLGFDNAQTAGRSECSA